MAFHEIHPWSLGDLIRAFVDLTLAYFLLWVSVYVFLASKILSIVGLQLPCPCNGVFGFRNSNICWHRLLFDLPVRRIYAVQMAAKSRFPFDQSSSSKKLIRDDNCEHGVLRLESETCSSSFSSSRIRNVVDRENGFDAKGKRVMNLKQRSGFRRRRRTTLEYGKVAPAPPNDSLCSDARVSSSPCDCREIKDKYRVNLGQLSGREDGPQDDVNAPTGNYKVEVEGPCHSFELSGSFGESNGDNDSVCFEKYTDDAEDKRSVVGSGSDTVRILKRALEEERAACAALRIELEKERAAAASAADEAMAMISRLQKDKASIEIEARQYQRMIEEKFAYDEEEMDILKEILVRREMDNHFLEKEIETYRQMSFNGSEQSKGELCDVLDEWEQRPLSSLDLSVDPQLRPQKIVNAESDHDNTETKADLPLNDDLAIVEKQSHSNGNDLIEKTVYVAGEDKDIVISQGSAAEESQACVGHNYDEVKLQKDLKHNEHADLINGSNNFYGKTELQKEKSGPFHLSYFHES
ncbi:hypothetical protein UlMin_031852 [Ulmus minor]